jgi:hypothetical protein
LTIPELKIKLKEYPNRTNKRLSGNKDELVARLEVAIAESKRGNNRDFFSPSKSNGTAVGGEKSVVAATPGTENDLFDVEYDGVERPIGDKDNQEKLENEVKGEEIKGGGGGVRDEGVEVGKDGDDKRYTIIPIFNVRLDQ